MSAADSKPDDGPGGGDDGTEEEPIGSAQSHGSPLRSHDDRGYKPQPSETDSDWSPRGGVSQISTPGSCGSRSNAVPFSALFGSTAALTSDTLAANAPPAAGAAGPSGGSPQQSDFSGLGSSVFSLKPSDKERDGTAVHLGNIDVPHEKATGDELAERKGTAARKSAPRSLFNEPSGKRPRDSE